MKVHAVQSASYFREKAEQCRRLRRAIFTRNDPTAASLEAMAVEFDAQATAIEARTPAADMLGYGDDVPKEQEEADELRGAGIPNNTDPNSAAQPSTSQSAP